MKVPLIKLQTTIYAPVEKCFELSLSPEVHTGSMARTRERIVTGRTTGIFALHDEVTWEAVHFGIRQRLTVRITDLDYPSRFRDEMVQGIFKIMRHEHYFVAQENGTIMRDELYYEAPLGIIGRLADTLFLRRYMKALLEQRNHVIKCLAETKEDSI